MWIITLGNKPLQINPCHLLNRSLISTWLINYWYLLFEYLSELFLFSIKTNILSIHFHHLKFKWKFFLLNEIPSSVKYLIQINSCIFQKDFHNLLKWKMIALNLIWTRAMQYRRQGRALKGNKLTTCNIINRMKTIVIAKQL